MYHVIYCVTFYVIFFAIHGSTQHFHQRSVQFNRLTEIMQNVALLVMAATIKADLITGNDGRIRTGLVQSIGTACSDLRAMLWEPSAFQCGLHLAKNEGSSHGNTCGRGNGTAHWPGFIQ
jgi:hypothetical protein